MTDVENDLSVATAGRCLSAAQAGLVATSLILETRLSSDMVGVRLGRTGGGLSEKLQLEAQGSHAGLVRFDQILAVLLSLKMSPIERVFTFYCF